MEYHVAKTGSDQGPGTLESPFLTINKAAALARAGDMVTVHAGVYREWVDPRFKGLSDKRRIVYQAAPGEKVVIKGSERIQSWERTEGTIWKAVLPNAFFGGYNPYALKISGDWLEPYKGVHHLGDVYLEGMSFYEAESYEALKKSTVRMEIMDDWTRTVVPIHNPEQTKYVWFATVDESHTTIYANFHEADPNEACVEINVRRSCFYPTRTGIDYITLRGFEIAHGATPWAPPTADQPGMVGANWSKGWIIEHNILHDAKCSAISIGKEESTGHNDRTIRRDKPGYQYQLESVFSAERNGWCKEKIGSHVIRYNTIFDCGQNGIVGHLGCVFSNVHHNHIYRIAIKREFYGYEIAGIKFHAAIDTWIHHNRIHDCSLGIWSDWETQGTRFSHNIMYQNCRDIFVEVSHGPYLMDHNIFASAYCMDNMSQGGAFVNNLFAGGMRHQKILDRSTQYHLPHSTKIAGFALVYGADDRFLNNLFIGTKGELEVGTAYYSQNPASLEEYIRQVDQYSGDLEIFLPVEQPAYIRDNVYLHGAKPSGKEEGVLVDHDFDPAFAILEEEGEGYLVCSLPESFDDFKGSIQSTATLERVRIVDAEYENPDGSCLVLDVDLLGEKRAEKGPAGPIASLRAGGNKIRIW